MWDPRMRFTLGQLMGGIAFAALGCSLLTLVPMTWDYFIRGRGPASMVLAPIMLSPLAGLLLLVFAGNRPLSGPDHDRGREESRRCDGHG